MRWTVPPAVLLVLLLGLAHSSLSLDLRHGQPKVSDDFMSSFVTDKPANNQGEQKRKEDGPRPTEETATPIPITAPVGPVATGNPQVHDPAKPEVAATHVPQDHLAPVQEESKHKKEEIGHPITEAPVEHKEPSQLLTDLAGPQPKADVKPAAPAGPSGPVGQADPLAGRAPAAATAPAAVAPAPSTASAAAAPAASPPTTAPAATNTSPGVAQQGSAPKPQALAPGSPYLTGPVSATAPAPVAATAAPASAAAQPQQTPTAAQQTQPILPAVTAEPSPIQERLRAEPEVTSTPPAFKNQQNSTSVTTPQTLANSGLIQNGQLGLTLQGDMQLAGGLETDVIRAPSGKLSIHGALKVDKSLDVVGKITVNGRPLTSMNVLRSSTGLVSVEGALKVAKNMEVSGSVFLGANAAIRAPGGAVSVDGDVALLKPTTAGQVVVSGAVKTDTISSTNANNSITFDTHVRAERGINVAGDVTIEKSLKCGILRAPNGTIEVQGEGLDVKENIDVGGVARVGGAVATNTIRPDLGLGLNIEGSVLVSKALGVKGGMQVTGRLKAGHVNVNGNLNVTGSADLATIQPAGGTVTVNGRFKFGGDLTVAGKVYVPQGAPLFVHDYICLYTHGEWHRVHTDYNCDFDKGCGLFVKKGSNCEPPPQY